MLIRYLWVTSVILALLVMVPLIFILAVITLISDILENENE